jgi:hypothetical protein
MLQGAMTAGNAPTGAKIYVCDAKISTWGVGSTTCVMVVGIAEESPSNVRVVLPEQLAISRVPRLPAGGFRIDDRLPD